MQQTPEGKIDALAFAVAKGLSVRAASKSAGVSERWAKELAGRPGFDARVNRYRDRIMGQAAGRYGRSMSRAHDELVALLKSKDENVRLSAAREINKAALASNQYLTLAAEVQELRAQIEQSSGSNPTTEA